MSMYVIYINKQTHTIGYIICICIYIYIFVFPDYNVVNDLRISVVWGISSIECFAPVF